MPKDAAYCPTCGRPVGVPLELADLEEDEELARQPITVEPQRPHGLRNLLIALAVVGVLVAGAVIVSRDEPDRDGDATAAAASTTTTSMERRATTTTASPVTAPPYFELAPAGPLMPEPTATVIYGISSDGRLVRIELDTGKVAFRRVDISTEGLETLLVPRRGGVVVVQPGSTAVAVPDGLGAEPYELDVGGALLLPGPAADELWKITGAFDAPGDANRTVQRVGLDGGPLGPELPLPPVAAISDDGNGGLLGLGLGLNGTYLLDPATARPSRILEGAPVGLNAKVLVDLACDASLSCRYRVTERPTAKSRTLPTTPPESLTFVFGGRVSADDRWLAVFDNGGHLVVVDLRDGTARDLGQASSGGNWGLGAVPAWAPNGRWLYFTRTGTLVAWRAGTDEVVRVGASGLPALTSIAAAPVG
jgi:hypothetical protein